MKAIQYFSKQYLESCKKMKPDQIMEFLDNFRLLCSAKDLKKEKLKLISIKISPSLLDTFKKKCELTSTPYQTQIKKLMVQWLKNL